MRTAGVDGVDARVPEEMVGASSRGLIESGGLGGGLGIEELSAETGPRPKVEHRFN